MWNRRRFDDISVSIQEHIDERTEELIEEGMPREQALQAARREFGNVTLIQQQSREVWQWAAFESLLADLHLALRRLKKSPGFAATVLLTIALGIGANTAVFSVVNSVLLKPLPYPHSEQLLSLKLNAPGALGMGDFTNGLALSPSMYYTFSENNRTFQSMGIYTGGTASVTGIALPEEVHTQLISNGVLETLNVLPVAGRWLSQADQDPHGSKTVMLSYGYWQRRFGGDRNVIGRTIQVNAQSREVIGVMPRGFRMVDKEFDLLMPLAFDRSQLKLPPFGYFGIGRLKPGVTVEQADADIARLLPTWMDSWSNGPGSNSHYYEVWKIAPGFEPLKQYVIGNIGSMLFVVMATIGLVMLIACTNIANLLLVRAESRQQELAIRAALGASRQRIARELLTESVTLGLMGGVIGVGVAYAGLRLLTMIGPANLPRIGEIGLDVTALGFTFLLSIVSGLLFGSIPVFRYTRAQASAMPGSGVRTASATRGQQRSRNVLVVAQVAMALVLLVSAVLMIRTFSALRNIKPGFADATHVQTMRIWIPDLLIPDAQTVTRNQNSIIEKLSAIPGVTSAGFVSQVPMANSGSNWDILTVEGKDYGGQEPPIRAFNSVSPGYFKTIGTRLVAGRDLTWNDLYALRPMVMVSENFARESWGSASAAIGKRVRIYSKQPWQEVIGVVEDVHQNGVDLPSPAIIYWPAMEPNAYSPTPVIDATRAATFVVHSDRAGSAGLLNDVQQTVWSVNSNLPLASVQTMQSVYDKSLARTSFTLVMLGIAGSMALALGIIGIYGVISYAVSQRTREIGIRLALGAPKDELKWMFVRSALLLAGTGVVIGLGTSAALMQMMKSLLFNISPLDPVTYITVPLILTTAAMLASYMPARRAASVDPVDALRAE